MENRYIFMAVRKWLDPPAVLWGWRGTPDHLASCPGLHWGEACFGGIVLMPPTVDCGPCHLPPFQGPQILQGLLRPSGVHLPSQRFHVQVRSQEFSPAFWRMYNWGCRCFKFSLIKENEHNARAGFPEMLVLIQDVLGEVVTYPDALRFS